MDKSQLIEVLDSKDVDTVHQYLLKLEYFNTYQNKAINAVFGAGALELRIWAQWLIFRVSKIGSTKAANEVEQFLKTDQLPGNLTVDVQGITVTRKMKLYKDVSIEPKKSEALADLFQAHANMSSEETRRRGYIDFEKQFETNDLFTEIIKQNLPSACLSSPYTCQKFITSESPHTGEQPAYEKVELMWQITLLISLFAKLSLSCVSRYWKAEAWVPITFQGASSERSHFSNSTAVQVNEPAIKELSEFLEQCFQLNGSDFNRLMLASYYMNQALLKSDNSRLIEFFIACEIIFLNSKKPSSKGKSIASNIQQYLNESQVYLNNSIYELFSGLYKKRNKLVHEGKLESSEELNQNIEEGITRFHQACKKIVSNKAIPKWVEKGQKIGWIACIKGFFTKCLK